LGFPTGRSFTLSTTRQQVFWHHSSPRHQMTTVDLNNLGYKDEPSILANDVAQDFYVKDMSSKPKKKKT
jgi:hypothetical protein